MGKSMALVLLDGNALLSIITQFIQTQQSIHNNTPTNFILDTIHNNFFIQQSIHTKSYQHNNQFILTQRLIQTNTPINSNQDSIAERNWTISLSIEASRTSRPWRCDSDSGRAPPSADASTTHGSVPPRQHSNFCYPRRRYFATRLRQWWKADDSGRQPWLRSVSLGSRDGIVVDWQWVAFGSWAREMREKAETKLEMKVQRESQFLILISSMTLPTTQICWYIHLHIKKQTLPTAKIRW